MRGRRWEWWLRQLHATPASLQPGTCARTELHTCAKPSPGAEPGTKPDAVAQCGPANAVAYRSAAG